MQAFQTVQAVAPSRSPKPILQSVKLEVGTGRTGEDSPGAPATLIATDLEVAIRHAVEGVDTETPGAVMLPVSRFGSMLRESSDPTFRIETEGQKTVIRGERSTFHLTSENAAEFPPVATFDGEACYKAPARLLKEMIRRTIFATDNESSRYALGGVKFEADDAGGLIAVGTDGRRLARMQGPIEVVGEPSPLGESTIVPSRSLQLIDRVLSADDEIVRLAIRASELQVTSRRATVSTRLLEGRFPKWRDVFPQRIESVKIELTVGPFFSAVRQAAIVTSDESRGIDFTFGEGSLVLAGSAAEVGESRVELPIAYDGAPIVITLDPRFMIDFLKTLDAETSFTLDLVDSDAAAVATVADGYGYVVMPLARDRS
ncbi:DNA polymerase III subunit beta [Botrimarina hoheduenensis]|uniref:Beta sliding clamp n=1 Tax=Botrimarina hoheduenensis TaxID=2528000 RepID=A0A5C5W7L1_9BACT|nr:DNA polymerase III subunit beta [Botrimarina hoheduenensis]